MHDLAKLWEFEVQPHPRLMNCFVTWLDEETSQLPASATALISLLAFRIAALVNSLVSLLLS